MTTKMLPCPFCGSTDIDPTGWANSEGVEGPVCNNCTASIGTVGRTTEANIAAWNVRIPGLTWNRVKNGPRPNIGQTVLLHTPQWSMTEGDVCLGSWDGNEWDAFDGRGWDDDLPVHWAAITWPDFEGDADEWSDYEEDEDDE